MAGDDEIVHAVGVVSGDRPASPARISQLLDWPLDELETRLIALEADRRLFKMQPTTAWVADEPTALDWRTTWHVWKG